VNLPFNISSFSLPIWVLLILSCSLAFGLTWFTIPSIVNIARLKNLCYTPNSRTSHKLATPTLGGIAVFVGLVLSTVIFAGAYFIFELKYIISALLIVFFVGVKDDILVIAPFKKLAGQIFAAGLIAIFADIRVTSFFGFLHINELPYIVSILITIFLFIVIINGFNLIDGIDGLASGIGILTASVFGIWFWITGHIACTVLSFSFVGALTAFFYFNVFSKKNKIFLGDTGSMVTGFVLGILACRFLKFDLLLKGPSFIASAPAVVFGILVIPLFDSLRVFILRLRQHKSPFRADRQHLHHYLLKMGLSHLQATLVMVGVNLFFILLSFTLSGLGIMWLMAIILGSALAMSHTLVMMVKRRRRIQIQNALQMFFAVKTGKDRTMKPPVYKKHNRLIHSWEPTDRISAYVN
jgi:UDP-N-acetylmuramyl pentapeptide phosphotransferase/UDP-N-acetylglucosamine-1-phosphate transferase